MDAARGVGAGAQDRRRLPRAALLHERPRDRRDAALVRDAGDSRWSADRDVHLAHCRRRNAEMGRLRSWWRGDDCILLGGRAPFERVGEPAAARSSAHRVRRCRADGAVARGGLGRGAGGGRCRERGGGTPGRRLLEFLAERGVGVEVSRPPRSGLHHLARAPAEDLRRARRSGGSSRDRGQRRRPARSSPAFRHSSGSSPGRSTPDFRTRSWRSRPCSCSTSRPRSGRSGWRRCFRRR